MDAPPPQLANEPEGAPILPTLSAEALATMGYEFSRDFRLVQTATGNPFQFVDQWHYEQLADLVAERIQEMMVQDYHMKRTELPLDVDLEGREPDLLQRRVPVFVSSLAQKSDAVLVLLCGSGRVAAGQWARRLCINDSLRSGSVLPFLDWAEHHGIGVVVLNPNARTGSFEENAISHVIYSWDRVIEPLPARHVAVVAHSYGGVGFCNLLYRRGEGVLKKVRAVAFTDSVHGPYGTEAFSKAAKTFFCKQCINWVTSDLPLDTIVTPAFGCPPGDFTKAETSQGEEIGGGDEGKTTATDVVEERNESSSLQAKADDTKEEGEEKSGPASSEVGQDNIMDDLPFCDCRRVSAGTSVHEETTWAAFQSVCGFILRQLVAAGAELSS